MSLEGGTRPEGAGESSSADLPALMQLASGFWVSNVLASALELGVFALLDARPGLTADEVARGLGIAGRGTRQLLPACAALGLLAATDGRYRNPTPADRPLPPPPRAPRHRLRAAFRRRARPGPGRRGGHGGAHHRRRRRLPRRRPARRVRHPAALLGAPQLGPGVGRDPAREVPSRARARRHRDRHRTHPRRRRGGAAGGRAHGPGHARVDARWAQLHRVRAPRRARRGGLRRGARRAAGGDAGEPRPRRAPAMTVSAEPLTEDCRRVLEFGECILVGLSPYNSFFRPAAVETLVGWAAARFDRVEVLLPGFEAAYAA